MLQMILHIFFKKEVLNAATTTYQLIKLYVTKKENQLLADQINLGTAVKYSLLSKGVTESAEHKFKEDCITMLVKIVEKLQERSPLKYMVVRNTACLSPINMVNNKEVAVARFAQLDEKLHRSKLISPQKADSAKDQFEDFTKSIVTINKEEFSQFKSLTMRFDKFLMSYLNGNKHFGSLRKIYIIVFLLSHSQCAVEPGLSVNIVLFIENI